MQQYQCLLVDNECYQRGRLMTPTKIVVHSTAADGANAYVTYDAEMPEVGN